MISRRTLLAATAALGAGASFRPSHAAEELPLGASLITGFRGTRPSDPEVSVVRRYLERGIVTGVIVMKRNVGSPDQLRKLLAALSDQSSGPPVVAIDQEGGEISRLPPELGFSAWSSARDIEQSGMDGVRAEEYYFERAQELARLGITLNFGPVVDLDINPRNPIIGALGRAYSADPARVTELAGAFVRAHRRAGLLSCLKHFPGHGSSREDTHKAFVDLSETWQEQELSPYRSLSASGLADAIMVAHVTHPRFSDAEGQPASLSRKTVRALRGPLGLRGPIFADDMQMGAITEHFDQAGAAIAALNAGVTFLIYSNYRKSASIETVVQVHAALTDAQAQGRLDAAVLSETSALAKAFRRSS